MKIQYNKYSDYLKSKYGEKVYKLPINLPVSCPNRQDGHGCVFCSDSGTGFEASVSSDSVTTQLERVKSLIANKYNAKKYIAYFQNFTNTFLPLDDFKTYINEAADFAGIVELSISTRPDCISPEYMEILNQVQKEKNIQITIELGLQTANYHTLDTIHRGHGLGEYIDAVQTIKLYGFTICTHVILNLPGDTMRDSIETAKIISSLGIDIVKLHSLYVAKNTILSDWYLDGTITLCSKEEYFIRVISFLEYLDPKIVVERLFSRIPEKDSVFSNWNTSWWKLQDELLYEMTEKQNYQGKKFNYLQGAALKKIK